MSIQMTSLVTICVLLALLWATRRRPDGRGEQPRQVININPLPPEHNRPAERPLDLFALIIAAGVALALIAGAIW